jgi:hypothetical protein
MAQVGELSPLWTFSAHHVFARWVSAGRMACERF